MCTVTFIPSNKRIILTSNRDEKHWRTAAAIPDAYPFQTGKIIFPRDGDAGGTWFAIHENGNVVIFLNGGFIRHVPNPPYRKSRGLVLLDLIDHDSPHEGFKEIILGNIEPFTAIIWDEGKLFECRWDGKEKHFLPLPADIPHIWSSATLYDQEVVIKRRNWFTKWLERNPHPSQDDILHFHQFTGDGDEHNDLMMNRDGKVFTVSITSALIGEGQIKVEYLDVKEGNTTERDFPIIKASIKA
jgi:transport and Golgi organization protein 2